MLWGTRERLIEKVVVGSLYLALDFVLVCLGLYLLRLTFRS